MHYWVQDQGRDSSHIGSDQDYIDQLLLGAYLYLPMRVEMYLINKDGCSYLLHQIYITFNCTQIGAALIIWLSQVATAFIEPRTKKRTVLLQSW